MLRFLLPLPTPSPNLGGTVELGGAASVLGERLGRGRSGVRIGEWAISTAGTSEAKRMPCLSSGSKRSNGVSLVVSACMFSTRQAQGQSSDSLEVILGSGYEECMTVRKTCV